MNGNSCGHNPDSPRWFEPPQQHTRPKIIGKALSEIRRYYREPAATIPSLNLANGSDRQQRSERREACLSVLSCLLHYLDLATLRVGIPQNDQSFQGISMPFIAEKSGLTQRRAERAIADLVKAGLIKVHPLCEKINDTVYKGYAAIRTISSKLFTLFGMGGRLRHERDKATARQRKRSRKHEKKQAAKMSLVMDMVANQANVFDPPESVGLSSLRRIRSILQDP
ncbi:MAG: replication protein RepA [Methylosarcina sp.]